MEIQQQNKLEGWAEAIMLLDKISKKIESYKVNSEPENKAVSS